MVRHGQAEGNRRGAFMGLADEPLTEKGRQQILDLRERIRDEKIDAVMTSPLQRAADSAFLLAEDLFPRPMIDDRLREQDYGSWDTMVFQDVIKAYPEDFNAWKTGNPDHPPTDGEPLHKVAERLNAWLKTCRKGVPDGGTLLAVGHGSAFQALLCTLLDVPLRNRWPFRLANGSLTEVFFSETGPTLTRLSWV